MAPFADIQYFDDRKTVTGEWLQNGESDVRRTGWVGPYYVPSVRENCTVHPIAELEFTHAALFAGGPAVHCTLETESESAAFLPPGTQFELWENGRIGYGSVLAGR